MHSTQYKIGKYGVFGVLRSSVLNVVCTIGTLAICLQGPDVRTTMVSERKSMSPAAAVV